MARIIRETITTRPVKIRRVVKVPVKIEATGSETIEYFLYYLLGFIEVLLGFRLLLKVLGAGTSSGFVQFIYTLTGVFIYPFEGIFRKAVTQGLESASVLEPATIVALIVYPLIVWGIVNLVRISTGERLED